MSRCDNNFIIKPFFEPKTDSIILYLEDTKSYSEEVDNGITIFRSIEDNTIVGVEIGNVSSLTKTYTVSIIESERGWGQKEINQKKFKSIKDAKDFVKRYNEENCSGIVVPEYYTKAVLI